MATKHCTRRVRTSVCRERSLEPSAAYDCRTDTPCPTLRSVSSACYTFSRSRLSRSTCVATRMGGNPIAISNVYSWVLPGGSFPPKKSCLEGLGGVALAGGACSLMDARTWNARLLHDTRHWYQNGYLYDLSTYVSVRVTCIVPNGRTGAWHRHSLNLVSLEKTRRYTSGNTSR